MFEAGAAALASVAPARRSKRTAALRNRNQRVASSAEKKTFALLALLALFDYLGSGKVAAVAMHGTPVCAGVVITGGAAGVGYAYADELLARGHQAKDF